MKAASVSQEDLVREAGRFAESANDNSSADAGARVPEGSWWALERRELGRKLEENRGWLTGVARRILGSHGDIEGAVQEAFIKLLRNEGTLRESGMAKSYLYSVIRSVCLDRVRQQKHQRKLIDASVEDCNDLPVPEDGTNEMLQIAANPEKALHARQREAACQALIEEARGELDPLGQAVLCNMVREQMTWEDWALTLGVSRDAVMRAKRRATEALQRKLRAVRSAYADPKATNGMCPEGDDFERFAEAVTRRYVAQRGRR